MNIITTTATIFLIATGAFCSPDGVCATVCSTEPIGVTWELRYIETGPPVYGDIIARGSLFLSDTYDRCRTLSHIPQDPGNYAFFFSDSNSVGDSAQSDPCVINTVFSSTPSPVILYPNISSDTLSSTNENANENTVEDETIEGEVVALHTLIAGFVLATALLGLLAIIDNIIVFES